MASTTVSFIPTAADIERYRRLRMTSRTLHQEIIETLPKNAVLEIGKRLGIVRGRTVMLDSEDMLSVIMDCCLYDLMEDGKNAISRYLESHFAQASPDERELLQASCLAQYRIVFPLSRVEGAGVYFKDFSQTRSCLLWT